MDPIELNEKIRRFERKKQEYQEEMNEAKKKYDEKIQEARTADEMRVPEIKSAASLHLRSYEASRSIWLEILNGLRFMQHAALSKRIDGELPDWLPTQMGAREIERTAQNLEERLEKRERNLDRMEVANERMEDTWQTGSTRANSLADERVEAAVEAAREGEDVPSLDELADETFAETDYVIPSPESEPDVAEEPERF